MEQFSLKISGNFPTRVRELEYYDIVQYSQTNHLNGGHTKNVETFDDLSYNF